MDTKGESEVEGDGRTRWARREAMQGSNPSSGSPTGTLGCGRRPGWAHLGRAGCIAG